MNLNDTCFLLFFFLLSNHSRPGLNNNVQICWIPFMPPALLGFLCFLPEWPQGLLCFLQLLSASRVASLFFSLASFYCSFQHQAWVMEASTSCKLMESQGPHSLDVGRVFIPPGQAVIWQRQAIGKDWSWDLCSCQMDLNAVVPCSVFKDTHHHGIINCASSEMHHLPPVSLLFPSHPCDLRSPFFIKQTPFSVLGKNSHQDSSLLDDVRQPY